MAPVDERSPRPVPWRTIVGSIGAVLVTLAGIVLVRAMAKVLAWIVVAAFFAVVVNPVVDIVQRRLRMKRGLATVLTFFVGFALFSAMLYSFIRPIVDQANEFADNIPTYVADAKAGRGQIGHLVQRYNLDEWVERNQGRLKEGLRSAGAPAVHVARQIANTVVAIVTIVVLTFLMVLEGPGMLDTGLNVLEERRRDRVRRVAADCAKAVTGYVAGNLMISAIAGLATFAFLWIAGVPFRGALGLWVAFADLIPLVGATLGAIPTVGVAFLHSTPAGIATVVFYVAYQQFENHVLQVTIMSRTVDLNPLVVLVSVLLGVEAFGLLGALLAIPAAGVIQVIVRDVYDEHRGRLKPEPTIGSEEVPISKAAPTRKRTGTKKRA